MQQSDYTDYRICPYMQKLEGEINWISIRDYILNPLLMETQIRNENNQWLGSFVE